MSDENGKKRLVEEVRDRMERDWVESTAQLLPDWREPYPQLRDMVLGNAVDIPVILPSDIVLCRRPLHLAVAVRRPQFGYVGNWTGKDLGSILEMIENDLVNGTGPWQLDWKQEKRLRDRWSLT